MFYSQQRAGGRLAGEKEAGYCSLLVWFEVVDFLKLTNGLVKIFNYSCGFLLLIHMEFYCKFLILKYIFVSS